MKKKTKVPDTSLSIVPSGSVPAVYAPPTGPEGIREALAERLFGQDAAIEAIADLIQVSQAGLAPPGRPRGIFLLTGPTGSGKTRAVEAVAEILHGDAACMVKIDCGEFQLDHEVAKILGSPPGYLGHRETQGRLTQVRLRGATTPNCDMSILLVDEVEKAAESVNKLLLGVLDKALLTLGDNTTVDFSNTLIFMTSNLASKEIQKEFKPFGLGVGAPHRKPRIDSVVSAAARRRFSPEFFNRVDKTIAFEPLTLESVIKIVDVEMARLGKRLTDRLTPILLIVSKEAREWLAQKGLSSEYGGRELKRVIYKEFTVPISKEICDRKDLVYISVIVAAEGGLIFKYAHRSDYEQAA